VGKGEQMDGMKWRRRKGRMGMKGRMDWEGVEDGEGGNNGEEREGGEGKEEGAGRDDRTPRFQNIGRGERSGITACSKWHKMTDTEIGICLFYVRINKLQLSGLESMKESLWVVLLSRYAQR